MFLPAFSNITLLAKVGPYVRGEGGSLGGLQQGFDIVRQSHADDFSATQKVDLAGNAFCGYVVTALCTSLMACVDWDLCFSAKMIPEEVADEQEEEEEGSEEEGDKDEDF